MVRKEVSTIVVKESSYFPLAWLVRWWGDGGGFKCLYVKFEFASIKCFKLFILRDDQVHIQKGHEAIKEKSKLCDHGCRLGVMD